MGLWGGRDAKGAATRAKLAEERGALDAEIAAVEAEGRYRSVFHSGYLEWAWSCLTCGAIAGDRGLHDSWHAQQG